MNISTTHNGFDRLLSRVRVKPGMTLGLIILTALIAFELFNYSTTDYALRDLLGPLTFAGIPWATILAIAFCSIDFAGIARLFTSERETFEPRQTWYLFGAWLLGATMNALLTWWGVSMAIATHAVKSTAVIDSNTLTKVIPVFVAVMVWVIRILIIGSLAVNGRRLFGAEQRSYSGYRSRQTASINAATGTTGMPTLRPLNGGSANRPSLVRPTIQPNISAAPRPEARYQPAPRPEPTYHSVSARPLARPAAPAENSSAENARY